jgi:hypothetical protein
MPWFFRTLADWHAMLDAAGLRLAACTSRCTPRRGVRSRCSS